MQVTDDPYFENLTSQTLQKALDGDTLAAIQMWKQIASGSWDLDEKLWCQEVAIRLLLAEGVIQDKPKKNDSRRKPDDIKKAVGFLGRTQDIERMDQIDEICFHHNDIKNLDVPEKRGEMVKTIAEELLNKKLVDHDTDTDKLISKRLNNRKS